MSDDSSATPPDQVPYENTADTRWAHRARELLQTHQLRVARFDDTAGVVSAHVWGTCPRCGHNINVQPTLTVPVPEARGLWATLTGQAIPSRQSIPSIPDSVEVGCGCGYPHPGAPQSVLGCGVSFRLPTPAKPSAPDTPGTGTPTTSPDPHTEPGSQ